MSERKGLNWALTKLVGKSRGRPSLSLTLRTFSPAVTVLGVDFPATSSSFPHRAPGLRALFRGPWQLRELGVITSSGHSQAQSAGLCKNTPEQASGDGEHLSPPWCEVFDGRKITNVSAVRRQTSAVPVRATLAFFKGTNSPTLGFFSSSSKMCLKRDDFWEAVSGSKLPALRWREITYQLFSISW